ncbi:MAG TPA: PSD1 and planctomycete cytochrome C domain-containing protein [Bryobacterales bacterium]|nr:PSD1 and planctomycete cytochrome C domain-containing protein [Bryobacterales bacterium]
MGLAPVGWWAILSAQAPVSFSKQVLPILSDNCFKCHGEAMQMSKLDLHSKVTMMRGGEHGAVITPGDAKASKLYRLVSAQEKPQMPLGGRLSEGEVAILRDWINQGAQWEGPEVVKAGSVSTKSLEEGEISAAARQYWAFQKPVRAAVPVVKNQDWGRHPIDAFLEKVFEEKGMTPAPPADKRTLVRRAYLDLIGLPPTPEQVTAFVNDNAADAWDKLIDRLLDSPAYGERWGRHWLDTARYADSSGFEHDRDRPNAWRYRDYVINAFNKDKPYNVFIKEQLAGDELDWVSFESKIATGFLRAGPRVEFREKDNPQYRYNYLDDMIGTTGQAFLGLTVQCARCHNHKFDPILQKDYYSMEAVFFPYVDVNYYLASPPETQAYVAKTAAIDSKEKALREEIAELEAPYREKAFIEHVLSRFPEDEQIAVKTPAEKRTPGQKLIAEQLVRGVGVKQEYVDEAMSPAEKAKKQALAAQVKDLEKQRPKAPPAAIGVADGDYRFAPDGYGDEPAPGKGVKRDLTLKGTFLPEPGKPYTPPPSYFLIRGDYLSHGSVMQPGFVTVITNGNPPTALPPPDRHSSGRRRALAEWIASADNPLTARVMVNRIWNYHFGRGIVSTLNNFGKMGERPTNQELLDWLATEFVARGWSIKEMHRLMMTSNAYKMASAYENAADQKADPENRLLWKFRLQRLDAEALRDDLLAVSGKLNREMGGPAVFPKVDRSVLAAMKNGIWEVEDDGPQNWRRSVYVYRKRGMPFPMFEVFDLPDQNVSCSARNISTVPTQALTLLNDEFVLRQARYFAERVALEAGPDPAAQMTRAYELALGRNPTESERKLGLEFLAKQLQFHTNRTAETGDAAAANPPAAPVNGVTQAHVEALADLTNVIFNLNEFVYIR